MKRAILRWSMGAAGVLSLCAGASAQVYSASPNVAVNDTPTVQSTIHVTGGPAITSLHVIVKILHTYDSDLDIVLVHNGTFLLLSSNNGSNGQNYLTTRFTDSALSSIFDGDPPFNNNFRPEGGPFTQASDSTIPLPAAALPNLAAFNGQSINGDWSLWVDDTESGDTGTLQYWSLEVNGATDSNGPFGGGTPPPPPPTCYESATSDSAGPLPGTAQVCPGDGALGRIIGVLDVGDTDMYGINICDPQAFSASTVGGTYLDTQIFLFDAGGMGVSMNDQDPSGLYNQSTITGVNVHAPGLYYLAVTAYPRDPVDSLGRLIWTDGGIYDNIEHAPDGPGAASPVAGWVGADLGGRYHMFLTGACFAGPVCGTSDFNNDGDAGTDADIEDFFKCLAGNCCPTCDSADFNGDGDTGTDADIESFFRVLAGQPC